MTFIKFMTISFTGFLLSISSVNAQVDTTITSESNQAEVNAALKSEELEVIKAFKAKLANASSLDVPPVIEAAPPSNREYDYDISIVPYDIDYADPVIKPFAMKPDSPEDFYRGYAKLGYGNYKSPLADFSFHNHNESIQYGIMGHYLSLDNSSNNPFQKMSDIDVNADAKLKINDQLNLNVGLQTSIDQRYFYHIDENETTEYNEEQAKRNLNKYGATIGVANSSDYALQYEANISANKLTITNIDTDELNISGDAKVSYAGENLGLSLKIFTDYSFESEISDSSLFSVSAEPTIYWATDNISIRAGANAISANDSTYFFPAAELLIDVMDDRLQFLAGVDQKYVHNSVNHIVSFNPYYQYQLDDYQTSIHRSYYGGLQGEWSKLNYRAKLGYKEIDRQVMLTNAVEDVRKFDLSHIDLNSIFIEATANYTLNEVVTIGAGFQQNIFDLEEGQKAYHIPSMRYNAFGEFTLLESKLTIRPSIAFTDKVDYIDQNGIDQKLDAMLSLNTQVHYKISEHFGLFVDAKNLLANNYSEYYGYEDVGIHIHGGITAKF